MSKTDALVKLYIMNDITNEWVWDEETEEVPNTSEPIFKKALTINYYFEKKQMLKFEVYDINKGSQEFLGQVQTTAGNIMAAKGQRFKDKLMNEENKPPKKALGYLIVKADNKSDNNNEVSIQASAEIRSIKRCCRDHDWPYLLIEYARTVPPALLRKG